MKSYTWTCSCKVTIQAGTELELTSIIDRHLAGKLHIELGGDWIVVE